MLETLCWQKIAATVLIWALFMAAVSASSLSNASTCINCAVPGTSERTIHSREARDDDFGETTRFRTAYTVISLFCISVLAGMVGHRIRSTDRQQLRSLSLTHVLIYLLYFLAISFVLSAAVAESGLGLSSYKICYGTIMLCLAFYYSSKVIMYIFLVERAHALRAPYMRRRHDWLWVTGTLTIVIVFGTIAITGFVWPIASMSPTDGRCRIGLPRFVTIPMLSFDVVMNILLTLIFVYLLSPLVCAGSPSTAPSPVSRFTTSLGSLCSRSRARVGMNICPNNHVRAKRMEKLLWRTFIGSCLVLVPTVGNMIIAMSLVGRELGWLCLTACSFDITWTVCVFHWLTLGSSKADASGSAGLVSNTSNTLSTSNASSEAVVECGLRS